MNTLEFDSPPWLPCHIKPVLSPGEVHVWRSSLDVPPASLEARRATLSSDELDRAARFHFDRDRSRFIAARGFLRDVLSRYAATRPHDLQFAYDTHGRPSLSQPLHDPGIEFNLSHSHDIAVCAVTLDRAVGIDIEYVLRDMEHMSIARRFFAPGEAYQLEALAPDACRRAFYACWTRKEAYVKALGLGLTYPFKQFEVSVLPGYTPELICSGQQPDTAQEWSLIELLPADNYLGALAIHARDIEIRYWDW